jgi:hypothetical protein
MRRGPEDSKVGAALRCGESADTEEMWGEPGGGFAPFSTATSAGEVGEPAGVRSVGDLVAGDVVLRDGGAVSRCVQGRAVAGVHHSGCTTG